MSSFFFLGLVPLSSVLSFSLSLSLFLFFFLIVSRCGSRADCRARYGGRRKIPFCEGRIIRSSVPTALRRSVAAAPPHPLPNHPLSSSPLGLGLFYLRASPTARETHPLRLRCDPPVSCMCARMRERKRSRVCVCMRICVRQGGIQGTQGAEE